MEGAVSHENPAAHLTLPVSGSGTVGVQGPCAKSLTLPAGGEIVSPSSGSAPSGVKRSGSYREKLPTLSPRSMKLFTDGLTSSSSSRIGGGEDQLTVDYGATSYDETLSNSSSSATSTDSGCPNAASANAAAGANNGRATSGSTEAAVAPASLAPPSRAESTKSVADDVASQTSHEDDIEFFVQVVGVFRQYITDQISALESKLQLGQEKFKEFQKMIKSNEEQYRADEAQLTADISRLTALLFQRQTILKTNLQNHNQAVMKRTREGMDACRKTLKNVSGTLAFAKNLREHSGENFREKAVKELKTRLKEIGELEVRALEQSSSTSSSPFLLPDPQRLALDRLHQSVTSLDFQPSRDDREQSRDTRRPPVIEAPRDRRDVAKDAVTVRWSCPVTTADDDEGVTSSPEFDIEWSYLAGHDLVTRSLEKITDEWHRIESLPSNCDVSVRVCRSGEGSSGAWSNVALYTTRPGPRHFAFDVCTAHAKLRLSNDGRTVCYGGDGHQSTANRLGVSPQSSARFTFALNVLGDIPFYSGRHYFEVRVNGDGWAVGVAYRDIARNSWLGSNSSSWILHFNGAKYQYKVRHAGESVDVKPRLTDKGSDLTRVGVYVNYEAGTLTFVNPRHKDLLHTCIISGGFTGSLCAAVNPFYHGGDLTLLTGLEVPDYVLLAANKK